MKELQNPHDSFVRAAFSKPEVARSFLANYLPAEIVAKLELDSLEQTQESFVDEDLRAHHTDLLYHLHLKNGKAAFVYVLLEHKSSPDKFTPFQLLRYFVRIWEKAKADGASKLPLIIPIVLYHGQANWKISRCFADLIEESTDNSFKPLLPNFEYLLCDLSGFDEADLRGEISLRFVLSALHHVFNPDVAEKLEEIIGILAEAEEKSVIEYLGIFLRYYSAATEQIGVEEFKAAIKKELPRKEGKVMATLAEQWVQQGISQGISQGRKEGIADLTLRLLKRKFIYLEEETAIRIRALKVEEIERLSEDLLDFEKPEDLQNWLAYRNN